MCLRPGRHRVVSTNAHRVAAHFVSGLQVLVLQSFLLLNIFYIVIILDVSENQYGDCIQNSGGWVMAERRGREAKVENSTNKQLLLCCQAITSQETLSDKTLVPWYNPS